MIDAAAVEQATAKLQERIPPAMQETGVPGLAFGVVFDDKVVARHWFGKRTLGQDATIDADTVFQLASVSKSLAGSVMAGLVQKRTFAWDDPVRTGLPSFALSDPWVSDHVSYADLFSHRSGLPDHAGDLLEDIGYNRDGVLERLRFYPLEPFRASYGYTNFGLTAAAVAGAAVAGMSWEDASRRVLYEPLGMTSTSSTLADFLGRANKASGHIRDSSGAWMVTSQQRRPDAQSPAGGASSSINDMVRWLHMELKKGVFEGVPVIATEALATTWLPHFISKLPDAPERPPGFYGLGMNVSYDQCGRLRLGHSGAFALGAGTSFTMIPAERIGIIVLTNGQPVGLAEAMIQAFYDDLFHGAQTRDWLPLLRDYFEEHVYPKPAKDFVHPPPGAAPPGPSDRYAGNYTNPVYGQFRVSQAPSGGLQVTIGPAGQSYALHPYEGDEMWWQFAGENAGPPAAATFAGPARAPATALTLNNDAVKGGFGTFTRP
ncbi:MAG: serine hydrolase domain-containing protein [Actinomycetota bacterium]